MQLFYAPEITLPEYTLSEEESSHAVRVLRKRVGDLLHITDGRGAMHRCEIIDALPKRCRVRVVATVEEYEKPSYNLTMAVAPTKNIDRFEWFLEKATEIGVARIVPLECAHSERRVVKHDRAEKVVVAAMKQSLKAYCPQLDEITSFEEFVAGDFGTARKFIAHCDEAIGDKRYLASILKAGEDAVVMIGPEGDFSREEIRRAVENGFEEITLGRERLRTETAGVVAVTAVSVLNYIAER